MRSCLSGGKVQVEFGDAAVNADAQLANPEPLPAPPPVSRDDDNEKRTVWRKKLGACIAESKAQQLQGVERKTFMSNCLKAE